MEAELKSLKEAGAGVHFQTIALPEGMAPTSSDVIASLNEHLVQVLQVCILYMSFCWRNTAPIIILFFQELSLKEKLLLEMEESLEVYKRKFAVARHKQGLIYKDYVEKKKVVFSI